MDTAISLQKPFFLYMAHYAVHLPYNADRRFIQKYLDQGYSQPEAAYCALIEGMDKSLGDLLDYIRHRDLEKNTIIVFMSDNGGFSHHPRQGAENTQNDPLRGGKGCLYEGGIREPMMVRWPGVTTAGSSCSQPVVIQDFFPTILDMAGIRQYNTIQTVDGRTMLPYFQKPHRKDTKRAFVWNFPNGWSGGKNDRQSSWTCAVRKGPFKLIYFEKYGRLELYNIEKDIQERRDLSGKRPRLTRKLARLLTGKLKEQQAQLPVLRRTGRPVPYPDAL
jgi:arylsulfatase A-like enzyme